MWTDTCNFYQFYPLGFCGAPEENDGVTEPRIRKVSGWIPHLRNLSIGAVYFSPVFESDRHGYDTRDYRKIDCRLGTNGDFAEVCRDLHAAGIRVVLDGVFNHVGRGFFGFRDVLEKRENSPYRDWFHIRFDQNNRCNDGLSYECWEGHDSLVKLNLRNPQVTEYLFESIRGWVRQFDIDGLRLDVAYCLDFDFLKQLRRFCDGLKPEFWLVGEVVHGDYSRWVNPEMLHSCTNYECSKGLYSSFNDRNLFEIAYSLNRQFGPDGGIYRGMHLLSFADNHDLARLASILKTPAHLTLVYAVMYGMPGVPCLYYGSEWGAKGEKRNGSDAEIRPSFDRPDPDGLTEQIRKMAAARRGSPALCLGGSRNVLVTNRQLVFERTCPEERILVAVNADEAPYTGRIQAAGGRFLDLLGSGTVDIQADGTLEMAPLSARWLKEI